MFNENTDHDRSAESRRGTRVERQAGVYGRLFVGLYLATVALSELRERQSDHPLLDHAPALGELAQGGHFLQEFARYGGNDPSINIKLQAVTQYRLSLQRALQALR